MSAFPVRGSEALVGYAHMDWRSGFSLINAAHVTAILFSQPFILVSVFLDTISRIEICGFCS